MRREVSGGANVAPFVRKQQAAARDFYDEFVNREEGEGLAQSDSKPLIQLQIHTTERPQPLREMTSDKVRRQNNRRRYFLGCSLRKCRAQSGCGISGCSARWC